MQSNVFTITTSFFLLFRILTVIFMSLQFDMCKFLDQIADFIGGSGFELLMVVL